MYTDGLVSLLIPFAYTFQVRESDDSGVGKTRGVGEVAPDLVHIVCVN